VERRYWCCDRRCDSRSTLEIRGTVLSSPASVTSLAWDDVDVQRRWRTVLAVVLVLVVILASLYFAGAGPHCRSDGQGTTPRAAVTRYYRYCVSRPEVTDLGDGDKESTPYASSYRAHEFEVVYEGGKTRFVLVGQHTHASKWRVLGGEGTGP
jgi:hypothetical protein